MLPTISEEANLHRPGSLVAPLPRVDDRLAPPVFSEHDQYGIVTYAAQAGRYKRLSTRTEDGRALDELYDVFEDLGEHHDLWQGKVQLPGVLEAALNRYIADVASSADPSPLDAKELERLRSLRYVR